MRERNFVGILFGQARLSGQMGEVLLAMAGGRCCRARWISQAALAPAGGCSAPWAPASRSQSSRADSLSKQCRDKQTQAQSPVSNFKGRAEKLKQARPAARALTAKEAKPQVQKPPTARAESRGMGAGSEQARGLAAAAAPRAAWPQPRERGKTLLWKPASPRRQAAFVQQITSYYTDALNLAGTLSVECISPRERAREMLGSGSQIRKATSASNLAFPELFAALQSHGVSAERNAARAFAPRSLCCAYRELQRIGPKQIAL